MPTVHELIFFGGAIAGAVVTTALAMLFATKAAQDRGLFTGLGFVFVGLALRHILIVYDAWVKWDIPDAALARTLSLWMILLGEAFLVVRLLRRPWRRP